MKKKWRHAANVDILMLIKRDEKGLYKIQILINEDINKT